MNDKYIDMQIVNVKQAMKITKNYMKIATNEYQMNYLKFNYEYLKNQLRYLNSIRPTEESNQTMPPNMIFTMEDIEQNYNGENGKPAYVVVDNVVFDVSNIESWAGGTHHGLYSGNDLTEEFNTCHKGVIEILKNVAPIVGYIVEN